MKYIEEYEIMPSSIEIHHTLVVESGKVSHGKLYSRVNVKKLKFRDQKTPRQIQEDIE